MRYVLDACALIAYLRGEPGADVVRALLETPGAECYAHAINFCELYYHFVRAVDEGEARQALDDLLADGVVERKDLGRALWQEAGRLKARGRISLADCFCIALARALDAEVVTSDRHEFEPLVPLQVCPIRFIR